MTATQDSSTTPLAADGASPQSGPRPSLRARVMTGAGWTVIAYGTQNVLRFGSNIVLTRILDPSAFGLMTLTTIFILGLELLSDVGVGPAIIHSKRGDDPRLLDTAWTVQIIRGFALLLGALVIAWPAARAYSSPQLTWLIAAAGLGIVVRGFTPTRVHSLNRQVVLGRLTAMELSCQVFSVVVTIGASWMLRSAWGLLIGSLAGDVARVALSFVLLPGQRHRLLLDKEAVGEIVRVGRWIILSTAVTYAAYNLDRLLMGRMLSVRDVGVYSIAFQIISAVTGLGRAVGSRVLFPVLAETARQSRDKLYPRLRQGRLLWILPTTAVLLVLAIWGDVAIRLLYKADYQAAGWMLRIMAAGAIFAAINSATGVVWPALGEFKMIAALMVVQVPVLVVAVLVGHRLHGVVGFVIGAAAVEALIWPVQSWMVQRLHKLWQPDVDLPVIAVSAAVVTVGFLLR